MFGSGAGPKSSNVWSNLNEFFVTNVLPSIPIPPMLSVTQTGSPLNKALYSGALKNLTILSFNTNWSINSWATSSVIVPFFKSLSTYMSKNVETLPKLIAAPFWSFIAPKYAKYVHWNASWAFFAGLDISNPYFSAIAFNCFKASIWSWISSLSRITSSVNSSVSNMFSSSCFSAINASTPYKATLL